MFIDVYYVIYCVILKIASSCKNLNFNKSLRFLNLKHNNM